METRNSGEAEDNNAAGPSTTLGATYDAASGGLPDYHQVVPTLRSNVQQMRKCISIDLLSASQREANFLRMIDRKAPMLYEPSVIENAIRQLRNPGSKLLMLAITLPVIVEEYLIFESVNYFS
ncbi:unnamed protein product [Gongylonema pulchrum]|uniref:Copine domain-containing protein n=1 Tax=Gongylonema pulchrum TaxID=637853 RepID=A0A183D1R9_9BILA|nr:unnamed protein product [Gongylonema pulchrum]